MHCEAPSVEKARWLPQQTQSSRPANQEPENVDSQVWAEPIGAA